MTQILSLNSPDLDMVDSGFKFASLSASRSNSPFSVPSRSTGRLDPMLSIPSRLIAPETNTTSPISPSPIQDAGRLLAFQVAESALSGSEDDDECDYGYVVVLEGKRNRKVKKTASWVSHLHVRSASSSPLPSLSSSPSSSPSLSTATTTPSVKQSTLSPQASPFLYQPRYTLPWENDAAAQAGMDVWQYQHTKMMNSQNVVYASHVQRDPYGPDDVRRIVASASANDIAKASASAKAKANTVAVANTDIGTGASLSSPPPPSHNTRLRSRQTHTRSQSGHTYSFITTTPPTPDPSVRSLDNVHADRDNDMALPPPPRSLTPLPFKRPAFAEAMHQEKFESILNCGRRPGLPSLAEMRAAAEKKGMSALPRDRRPSPSCTGRETFITQFSTRPNNQKRMSMDSTSSCESVESLSSGSSSDANASEPTTPIRSRLPSFLLRGRSSSTSSSGSSDSLSSRPVFIRQESTDSVSGCPMLRVIPPSHENRQEFDEPASIPMITCTPASAPGVKISPFAELEVQVQARKDKHEAVKRAERSKMMISTLGKRTQQRV